MQKMPSDFPYTTRSLRTKSDKMNESMNDILEWYSNHQHLYFSFHGKEYFLWQGEGKDYIQDGLKGPILYASKEGEGLDKIIIEGFSLREVLSQSEILEVY